MFKKGHSHAARSPRRRQSARLVRGGIVPAAALAAVAAAAFISVPARGEQLVWDRGAGTLNWGDAANWSPDAVPGAATDVLLTSGIFDGDVFDLGGTTRAVNSFFLHHSFDAYAIAHGTLNLRGSNAFNGLSLEDWSPNVTLAADVLLGDPAAAGGNASFKWNLSGTLAITGSIAKASAAQAATLTIVGIGTVLFTGPAALHDDTTVTGGSIVFRPATAGPISFGTGTISTVRPSGSFVLSGSTSQEYALANPIKADPADVLRTGAAITLESMPGANPTFALTGHVQGGLTLRATGANSNPLLADVRGDVDLTTAGYGASITVDNPTAGLVRISGSLTGGTGQTLTGTGKLLIAGPANTISGWTIVTKSLFVEVAPGSSLGTSSVSLRDTARLRLTDLATNLAPAAKILVDGASLVELPGTPAASALAHFDPTSTGVFGLTGEPTGMNFNAGGFQDLQLGTASDLHVHDAWTPHANGYRIWGGWGGATLALDAPNLLTGPAAFFVHGGSGVLGGHTVIAQPQDLGGDTWVQGGTLTLQAARALGTSDVWVSRGTLEVAAAGALDAAQLEWGQTGTVIVSHPDAFRTDAAAPTPMLKLPYGTLAFDTGTRPGVTAFDVSITSIGNKPNVEARATLDDARASVHDLAMWASTVNFGAPAAATVRTGLRVEGATTFAPGAVFNVTAPAAVTATDAGGSFLALDGPVTASKPATPLVKSGPGTLGLFNAANAFAGLTVTGGLVAFDSAGALGDPAGTIALSGGGGLRYAGATPTTIGHAVAVGSGGATVDAYGTGSLTLTGPLSSGTSTATLTKTGSGTLVLAAANNPFAGSAVVQAGTLRVTGFLHNATNVTVSAGATFEAGATQSLASLAVAGGGAARITPGDGRNVLTVKALDLATANATTGAPGATLDLTNGGLVYDYAGSTPALAYVRDRVRSGYAGGAWTGPGIVSSSAAASAGRWGVGFGEARDVLAYTAGQATFMGASVVDDSAVLVRTTVLGDANLDGVVNFTDLLTLARHYNTTGDAAVWTSGDFTYDGVVNFADLLALARNYNQALPAAGAIPGATAAFDADLARAFAEAAMPEPTAFAVLAVATCGPALGRRSRRIRATGRTRS